jgi:formate dehydrogenase major subunit
VVAKAPDHDDGELLPPRVTGPKATAAGPPAVLASARMSFDQMGLTRSVRTLTRLNQKHGFDCPGCAWPDPEDRGRFEFCENGAKAVAEEATRRRVNAAFFAEHALSELAERSDYWLGQQGRLTEPMYRPKDADHYQPISWETAIGLLADRLKRLPNPDRAVFYTSGRTSNEAAFVYQLLVRQFGTNNLPDCSNMCHESSGAALLTTIGAGKGSVTLEDIYAAELIFVVGQNPGTNHPRMLSALEKAKENGARIVAVNPLPEAGLLRFKNPQRVGGWLGRGTALADDFLQVRVNGDQAVFRGLSRLLLDAEEASPGTVLDHPFLDTYTAGLPAYLETLRTLDWADVERASGLARTELEPIAELASAARSTIVCWAMGLTQHKNSVATIREIVNFLLLRGNIGRPGAGVCPVRGHSNVQGDRTMGIYERPTAEFLDALEREFGFAPPREPGLDTVDAIRAMAAGDVDVFMAVGGNFVRATPDSARTESALRRCELTVQVSTKLNRSHVVCGAEALILPTLGRTERDGDQVVTVEDSMGAVHASRGRLAPASPQLRSETGILSALDEALLGTDRGIPWRGFAADYGAIRDRIAHVVPGFEDFNAKIARPGGFLLPHAARDSRTFATASGRAEFTTAPLTIVAVPAGHLLLQTIRSHDQYNTTIYGLDDRYRGISGGRRVVLVNPDDITALGLQDGQHVDLVGVADDGVERRAECFRLVGYPIAAGCAASYFPETNCLVPLDSTADESNTPTSKSVVIRLEPTRLE